SWDSNGSNPPGLATWSFIYETAYTPTRSSTAWSEVYATDRVPPRLAPTLFEEPTNLQVPHTLSAHTPIAHKHC
ncbi:MAG: hypothetical protein KDA47_01845, partial [Planctomycetales bacterium]|nr:hypothetical protein [Planctomycetales bacterium]